jgi:hypothetical protein
LCAGGGPRGSRHYLSFFKRDQQLINMWREKFQAVYVEFKGLSLTI